MRNRCTSGAAGSRVSSNRENRHRPSRSATIGCKPRCVRSSTGTPSGPPEGEPGRRRPRSSGAAHRHRDPLDGGRDGAELAADPLGAAVGVAVALVLGRLGGHVEVDEHGPAGREGVDQLGQVGPRRAFPILGHGRDDQVVLPVVGVLGGQQRAAAALGDLDVPQEPDPVVAPGHHLEHDRVVPLGEDAEDRRARGDDGVDLGRPGLGVRRQAVEFRAHLLLGRARSAAMSGASKQR